nr:hypothetical protein KitaXyl93_42310 [Kitasatospora sp. Xyl93]
MDTPASAAIASMLARAYPSRPNTAVAARVIALRFSGRPAPPVAATALSSSAGPSADRRKN